ncbi:transposase InsO family protein [Saccharomonospora amisosensis]|uniref:Mu transposase/integrase n=2 Tax=Saccharomonospora TaxID=1851 RepID=H5X642_9PSEU|nr:MULTISPECIES: Mu transposase C-terminal domain-containing protein [Saccharomonospora]EHR53441.1 Mu transposase/integrase [Saccharomonospora marina XMU15]NIJ09787.1 transposase InsO family protein [Saccharomonospora amisosensis]
MTGANTVLISVGTRLSWDGDWFTVVGLEADRLRLRGSSGQTVLAHTATLLADPMVTLAGADTTPAEWPGSILDDLTLAQRKQLGQRLAHVQEVLTGYRGGGLGDPVEGEPRPGYDPRLPLRDRYAAKAAELGVTMRTLERWVAAFREAGPVGLVDHRGTRMADPVGGVDERWLAMCKTVLAEHTDAARPTQRLVLQRVSARLAAEHGVGEVEEPGRRRARAVLAELSRGTNAFTGSTKGKRSIAARPQGVYGRLRPTRPGEYLLLDSTPLDVFAMEPLTLRWVRVELTIAMDLYSRSITGLRLSPVSTKSVDAALVLFEALRPNSRHTTSSGLLPYAGLPDLVVVAEPGAGERAQVSGLAGVAAETIVVDHGKIYLSQHLLGVCQRLGISVQPARPLTPTDKAAVERFFRTLREQLLEALPGYKGPDVHSRGKDPEGCTYFFLDELESVVREWIGEICHHRPHSGLAEPHVPGLVFSPAEMFAHGMARTGRLRVPSRPEMVFDFLPVAWRSIQHYGVELNGLRYNGPALTPYRNRTSPFTGAHRGKWPVRYDTDDVSRVYFQDPADQRWHTLAWEHATDVAVPFSADALTYARRLALTSARHVDDRAALAQLLHRFDAGLTRNPTERRLAIRASAQRHARLAAATGTSPEIAQLPTVRAVTHPGQPTDEAPAGVESAMTPEVSGDDDCEEELDRCGADEPAEVSDEDFYAEALEVLP